MSVIITIAVAFFNFVAFDGFYESPVAHTIGTGVIYLEKLPFPVNFVRLVSYKGKMI